MIMTFLPSSHLKANAHYSLESLCFDTWGMLEVFDGTSIIITTDTQTYFCGMPVFLKTV